MSQQELRSRHRKEEGSKAVAASAGSHGPPPRTVEAAEQSLPGAQQAAPQLAADRPISLEGLPPGSHIVIHVGPQAGGLLETTGPDAAVTLPSAASRADAASTATARAPIAAAGVPLVVPLLSGCKMVPAAHI